MDVLQIIEEIEDLLDEASTVPFSKKVMVDTDEVFHLLQQIRQGLPGEIKQAQWVNEEKDRILAEAERDASAIKDEANKEADKIINDAKETFNNMISEHEITKSANEFAEDIVSKAEENARVLKTQSLTYVDEMLQATQDRLKEILNDLEEDRKELR
ncbi:ATPase [Miniphocaeibacter halophilus]|uniref:ATPase n=1 Tax=Miniphocaeibacter halophilus TaxID=2931922 RepID=A0AC61MQ29_9FIRM|nr:ATPase [Miniphocaeibacter halophilus]QQK07745.1 ATPase [Miniphocaeibacter halophilus]